MHKVQKLSLNRDIQNRSLLSVLLTCLSCKVLHISSTYRRNIALTDEVFVIKIQCYPKCFHCRVGQDHGTDICSDSYCSFLTSFLLGKAGTTVEDTLTVIIICSIFLNTHTNILLNIIK